MKIYVLMKIVVEGCYSRYYTPMIDTGAEANYVDIIAYQKVNGIN